jgi:serine protease Do
MRTGTSLTGERGIPSRRRLALLASTATIAVAILLAAPNGSWKFDGTTLVGAAQVAETAGPAGFADIVSKVKPAVVSVRVRLKQEESSDQPQFPKGSPFGQFFRRFGSPDGEPRAQHFTQALGSAFFISPDGFAVTNNHVVKNAQAVEITTAEGKTYKAKVIGTDAKTDVALIKVDGRNDFPYVNFSSSRPRIGDWVIAVGNPYGLGGTVTAGIVSAEGRDIGAGPYDDFIQIDAPVNKGNSGGPAFDESGNVVGVTTAIFSPSGGSVGIGFAIPADTVKLVVAQLEAHGSVTRGWIGVQIQTVTQDIAESLGLKQAQGALVAEPERGGPAANAGIAAGDVIESVNGQEVKSSRDLAQKVAAVSPGTKVELGVLHNGSQRTVSVTVAKMPSESVAQSQSNTGPSEGSTSLGLTLAPPAEIPGEGNRGVVVTNVNPDGPAAGHGVRNGDVILEVSGKAVNAPADVRQALNDARGHGKHSVLMRIKSGDSTHIVALPLATG